MVWEGTDEMQWAIEDEFKSGGHTLSVEKGWKSALMLPRFVVW